VRGGDQPAGISNRSKVFGGGLAEIVGSPSLSPAGGALTMTFMLELRPSCENCQRPLPPDATEAMICSFECTFCAGCVAAVLQNVCPNCGGGFAARPVRPRHNWSNDNYLGKYPPSSCVRHVPVDRTAHARLVAALVSRPPEQR
jgi:hypothetical protein